MPELGRQILNPLADFDDDASPNASRDDLSGGIDDVAEPDLLRHVRELAPIKIFRQPLPGSLPVFSWPHYRVDAKKRYTA